MVNIITSFAEKYTLFGRICQIVPLKTIKKLEKTHKCTHKSTKMRWKIKLAQMLLLYIGVRNY